METEVAPALESPCGACPWRTSNQGRQHPNGWYTKRNLSRLWGGMRRGEAMTCHPTDPSNPMPDGWREVPADAVTRECAGYQTMILREWSIIERITLLPGNMTHVLQLYRRLRPRGLTEIGVAALIERTMYAGTPLSHHWHKLTSQDLDAEVSYPDLPWPVTDEAITEVAIGNGQHREEGAPSQDTS